MKVAGARVEGSAQSFGRLRSEAIALWHSGGVWTASVTLNPSELSAGIVFEMCGAGYSYATDTGIPTGAPGAMERWKIIASNPVVCAEFFRVYVLAFIETFLGWPRGAPCQVNQDCVFGPVVAWYLKFQVMTRGALHAHGNIIQPQLQPASVRKLFDSPTGKRRLQGLMQSLMMQRLPSPYSCALPRVTASRLTESEEPVCIEAPTSRAIASALPSLTWEAERLMKYVAQVAVVEQNHCHTSACGANGKIGTDDDCRLTYPRSIVPKTLFFDNLCVVELERQSETMPPYLVPLLLALPCNHNISLGCEIGHWRYKHNQWRKQLAKHPHSQATEPELPSIEESIADSAEYNVKYNTKVETSESVSVIHAVRPLVQKPGIISLKPPIARGVHFLAQALNAVNGTTTFSVSLSAHIILGYGDSIVSHKFIPHDLELFADYAAQQADAAEV